MVSPKSLIVLATASVATAQNMTRPMNTSICDYYTTALLKNNTGENQYKVLQLVVNTALIGNYTMPNVGVMVPGILTPGEYMGQQVNLAPYFSGALASTNRNNKASSLNFLDGGGAVPLKAGMMAKEGSNQQILLSHLYSYFGALLQCSQYGKTGFPAYAGSNSQASVHKYMDLNPAEVGYFIQQVGLSAASFGVTMDDVTAVGKALNTTFGYRCSPPTGVIPNQMNATQSICQAQSCPLDAMSMCSAYDNNGVATMPMNTTGGATAAMNGTTTSGGSGSSGSGGSGSMSSSAAGASSTSNGAGSNAASLGAAAAAAAVFAFAL